MARRKRSDRQAQTTGAAVVEKPQPQRVSATPTGEYRSAICPVCGRAAGKKRLRYPYDRDEDSSATQNFWEYTLFFDPDKPFGVIQQVGLGKGKSFKVVGHFGPNDDPDGYFPLVKGRLLGAVREYLAKGWVTREELMSLIGRGGGPELESDLEVAIKEFLAQRKKVKVTELTAAVLTAMGLDKELTDASRQRQAAGTNRKVKAILWQMERDGLCAVRSLGRVVEWIPEASRGKV